MKKLYKIYFIRFHRRWRRLPRTSGYRTKPFHLIERRKHGRQWKHGAAAAARKSPNAGRWLPSTATHKCTTTSSNDFGPVPATNWRWFSAAFGPTTILSAATTADGPRPANGWTNATAATNSTAILSAAANGTAKAAATATTILSATGTTARFANFIIFF